ncbi:MAG: efflux RND transporter periplasmic adaptor subunit [Candidatus Fonsibacter ubiquis]|jgi:membrane fusion protein (multidrug efflux system)|nr:efflux RND transporter periplasmic adaptor subunit [Candidatus Fonsibacter ubiquis]NCW71376.1 efflux RND transporter periplasmic adaptor subunit [Pseudomonadota bacterium]GBL33511.1 multidrug resistance protein MdtA [Pelagibacterales bacterium]NCU53996.1 efflux RND transporter periplasmic adaptor subunit [Candidatus Fonsibacter ubiquis]NCU56045.1 efflux RND transporter periplasmic adaptor subunit [Candidatus Fonsibacter ubiquis]
MNTSKKIIIAVSIITFLVVAIIAGRMILNNVIQKKINETKPTEVVAQEVKKTEFYEKIETFGTALANQSFSIRIKKSELISSLEFDKNLMVQKNQLIAQLKNEKIIAPFSGRLGIREITPGILGGEDSIIATLDDIENIKLDIKVPESYSNILKRNLKIKATSESFNETFFGNLDVISSRVDPTTRSILVQAKIKNNNYKIIPGMLINIEIIFNEKESIGVPEESIIQQGTRTVVYKVIEDKTVSLTEVKTGIRNFGKVEILSGLSAGDKIVTEGVSKIRDKAQIKLINK